MQITEQRFRDYFEEFPNQFGDIYTMQRKIDNDFNLSYHLNFKQKNIQYNFWLEKLSYLNSTESVTISFFNGNEKFEKDKLKTISKTCNLNELKEKVNELLKLF